MTTWEGADALIGDPDTHGRKQIAELLGRLDLAVVPLATGAAVLDAAARSRPALVALSVDLEGPTGYEVCRELRERFGEALPVVFLAGPTSEPRDEIAGLLLGADDYFSHPLVVETFLVRVRRLLERVALRPPTAASSQTASLTPRELEVLALLAAGERSPRIADLLGISRKTAQSHIEHVLVKLGAHSQAQAVAAGMRIGLVDPDAVRGG